METLSFAFGVLSMVGLLSVITIVLGIVKVIKNGKRVESLNGWITDLENSIWRSMDDRSVEINSDLDDIRRELTTQVDQIYQEIDKRETFITSYIDSRLDRLEQKLTSTISAKQNLKG
jgi:hypothetical protein